MGFGFARNLPEYQEDLWIGMRDGEDGVTTQRGHTTFPAVIIQHVVHLTGVHVHVERLRYLKESHIFIIS